MIPLEKKSFSRVYLGWPGPLFKMGKKFEPLRVPSTLGFFFWQLDTT